LRLIDRYDAYNFFDFSVPIGSTGDSYDRFLIRLDEMRESLNIMEQSINILYYLMLIGDDSYIVDDFKIVAPSKLTMKTIMEGLIHHFKLFTDGFIVAKNNSYGIVEAPKGEFGVFLFTGDNNRPFRCRIKSPGFLHLQTLGVMSMGAFLSDVVTIIGTQDLVFGEVDR